MDLGTILGIVVALVGILFGQYLEGGSVFEILQPTAALIVVGGTIGSTMIGFSLGSFQRAVSDLMFVFKEDVIKPNGVIDQIIAFTNKARREGIISLEQEANDVEDPFFKKSIMMAVDGSEPSELRDSMEVELSYMDERGETSAKIFEAAGGVRANDWHYRCCARADPGYAKPGRHRRSRSRYRCGFRGDDLRSRTGEHLFPARCCEAQVQTPQTDDHQGNDAGRYLGHSRRPEPASN